MVGLFQNRAHFGVEVVAIGHVAKVLNGCHIELWMTTWARELLVEPV